MHWIENIVDINFELDDETNRVRTSNSSDSVWVLHKSGFVNARRVKPTDDSGKCTVRLDTGQCYDVSDDDIENVCSLARDLII